MKCKIDITASSDIAAWVTRGAFLANVDQDDLACRESKEILDYYHQSWFRHDDNGDLFFTPPAFQFRNGYLFCINGRHRAILLYRHLEVIPMLLVRPEIWPVNKLAEIMQQKIRLSETVDLPDLSINVTLEELM